MSFSRRNAALGLFLLLLIAVGAFVLAPGGPTPFAAFAGPSEGVHLSQTWLSDTERQATGNHHAATGARIDGAGRVFAPISGGVHDASGHDQAADVQAHDHAADGHDQNQPSVDGHGNTTTPSSSCGLYALNGSTGGIEWRRTVPAVNCSIHSIADPTVADVTAEPGPAVLATSTTERLTAYHASDGATLFERPMGAHGYTRPVVANLTSNAGPEILAVDVQGNATLFASAAKPGAAEGDGDHSPPTWTSRWSVDLDGFVWAEPQVVDLNGDGRSSATIAVGDGRVVAIEPDGSVAWNRSALRGTDGLTWATSVDADGAPGRSIVVASSGGLVVRVAGDGTVSWRRDLGDYAAVRATMDASRDGSTDAAADARGLVYATNRAGDLIALDARSGETVWQTTLTDADVQMTPPPSIGDVVGGPAPELVAVTNDGGVHVVDPTDGTMLASGGRSTPIFTHASLVDLDADPEQEIVVTYGDGRIARFDASAGT